ncbi:hypothetical protein FNV43_RR15581 [Rhamnella rubrinervis]|uniref:Uncharacterized protein n=1 Tax=Rhamnella rubrinervis TaxID=2594499 RepID=A0A8K0E3P0_9ROSA|nr:hypothetical protein FNV43_RR15581 [Rhamnella rubrinervis]
MPVQIANDILKALWKKFASNTGPLTKKFVADWLNESPKTRHRVKQFQSSFLGKQISDEESIEFASDWAANNVQGFVTFTGVAVLSISMLLHRHYTNLDLQQIQRRIKVVEESIDNLKKTMTALETANETANLKLNCSIDQLKTELTQLQSEQVLLKILMEEQKKDVEELKKSGEGKR